MSDAEDFDELPQITVNTANRDSSTFVMPSAEVLATKRAREEQCERELRELRERDVTSGGTSDGTSDGTSGVKRDVSRDVLVLTHSDSSGSEGETALAAAVTALSVAPPPAPRAAPLARHLLRDMKPLLPGALAEAVQDDIDVDAMVAHISASMHRDEEPSEEEAGVAGAVLLSALAAGAGGAGGRRAARTLHALLDARGGTRLAPGLARAAAALGEPRARLRLADACRSGAGRGADHLADALVWRALADELRVPPAALPPLDAAALLAAWRAARASYPAVQLAARALASLPSPPPAALLAALQPPPPAPHRPADLQVVVLASKLRLLFRAEK